MKQEGADPWTFDAFLWLPTVDHDAPSPAAPAHGHRVPAPVRAGARCPSSSTAWPASGRSSTLVLAYLLAGEFAERGPDAALDFLCARRACVNPNARQIAAAVEAAKGFRG